MPKAHAPVIRATCKFTVLLTTALVVGLALPRDANAGAWAQEDKSVYLKASLAHSFAEEQFKAEGENLRLLSPNEPGRVSSTALRMYGEFGLLPKLTYVASTSLIRTTVDSKLINITTTGMADFTTGLKFQFLDEPLVASVSSMMTLPTGYTAQPENPKIPTLGLGVPMYAGHLLIGKSFYPLPVYASGSVGYRMRGSRLLTNGEVLDYPPEIPYAAEIGVTATDFLLVRGALQGLHGLGNPEELNVFSLSPKTQSYIKAGPSVIVSAFDHFQFNVDYLYTVTGVNAIKSHSISAGIALDHTF